MKRIIRINAVSPYFSFNELIEEKKSVRRLEAIKRLFDYSKKKFGGDGKLSVKTEVVNPELAMLYTAPMRNRKRAAA